MRKKKKIGSQVRSLGMLASDIPVLNNTVRAGFTVRATTESQTREAGIRFELEDI